MGIKNLNTFLKKHCPDVFSEIPLVELQYATIAIDTSLYILKYKATQGNMWLVSFVSLVACLRKNDVHCVFVYDTQSPPEKLAEKRARYDSRARQKDRVQELRAALARYEDTGEVSDALAEASRLSQPQRSLLRGETSSLVRIESVYQLVEKLESQIISITPQDIACTKELFDIMRIPYVAAQMEGETECARLCLSGRVQGVLSEDTDVLAYGTPVFLSKINISRETCTRVLFDDVLVELGLSAESFRDFCIMCGTDYNRNIPKIGPENAYKLIKRYASIDALSQMLNVDVLNHRRVRELFTVDPDAPPVEYCAEPDWERLYVFLAENGVRMNIEALRRNFECNLVFETN
jgi:5'-3' exonuclease